MGMPLVRHGVVMIGGRHWGLRFLLVLVLGCFNSAASAVTLQAGTMPGNFSVSAVGAATYQIPIEIPSGVNGLKPSLGLLYNSQAGAGQLGMGWSLIGLSVITRCPQTTAQDQNTHLPDLSLDDRFCLDGRRLILTSGSYGTAGSTYRTETESFQQVTAKGTAGNGPSSFTVVDRAGLTRTYSTQLMRNGGTTAMEWLLTSITDKYGNYVAFQYNIMQTQYQPVWQEIAEIDYGYGYSGPNSGTAVGKVVFGYGTSGDPYTQNFAHTYVGVNMALLTSIAVEDGGGAVLRQYRFAYNSQKVPAASPAVSLNELNSVQECSGFSFATCFNPTTFTYNGAFTSFGAGAGTLGSVTMGYLQVADLDGDGLPDYVYEINSQVYVTFGNQNANSTFVVSATTRQNPGMAMGSGVPIDLYGDGKQEMLVPYFYSPGGSQNNPYWKVLSWNGRQGSGANLTLTEPAVSGCAANTGCLPVCWPPNVTGCSTDAVAVDPEHTGQQGLLFVSGHQLFYYPNVNGVFQTNADGSAIATGITVSDVNGIAPALTPVNFSGNGEAEIYVAGSGVAYWKQADAKWELEKAGNFDDANSKLAFVDNNGDGLTGVFEADQGNFWFWPNAGDGSGFRFESMTSGAVYNCYLPAGTPDTSQMLAIDWYHDGRQELLIPVNGVWKLVAFSAQTPSGCTVTNTNIALQPGQTLTQLLDVDGDGQPDMVFTNTSSTNPYSEYLPSGGEAFTLSGVTDGLGHQTQVGYSPLGREVYVTGMSPVGAGPEIQPYVGALQVVKDFAVDTGTLNSSGNPQQIYTYYLYGGAAMDVWGRGFLGFAQVEAVNYNSNLYNTVTYEQAFPFTGLVDSETKNADPGPMNSATIATGGLKMKCTNLPDGEPPECNPVGAPTTPAATWVTGGTTLSKTTICYSARGCVGDVNQVIQTYNGVYYPAAISNTQRLYDLSEGDNFETVVTNTHYTQISSTPHLGVDYMPDDITVTSTDNTKAGDSGKVDTKTVYADDPSASAYAPNCPGRPVTLTVTNTFQGVQAKKKVENFTYDGTSCFLTSDSKAIFDPAGQVADQTLTKTYTPDGYGNPVKVIVTGDGLPSAGRTTTTTYDVTQRFPAYVTNALNQTETLTYDPWGHKLSDTDANGNTITYGYSHLGRLNTQSGPRSKVNSSWSYSATCNTDCLPGSAPAVMETTQTNSDGSVLMTQTDELGRSLRAIKKGFAGEYILQDTQYDMLGRMVMTTLPYKDSTVPAASCEDIKTYDLLNRVTKEVQPYKTNSDGSCVTRTITTAYADFTTTRTIKDKDPNAKISQEVTVTTLNVLAKPDSATDLNAGIGGTTSYTYDPWGNLTNVSSPDKGSVGMAYDSEGNKLGMTDPDMGSWIYRYDALGELTSQTDANGNTVSNTYDALGRLIQRDEPEGHTFWKYDVAYGAGIGHLAYTYTAQPDESFGSKNAWEGYAYDVYGEATDKITLVNGQEYWVTTTYDDLGRPSQLVYPDMNGISASGTPATPTGLNAVVDTNDAAQIDVTWTLAKSGQIYHLYRTLAGVSAPVDADEIYSGPTSAWADDTLTVDGSYTWWLKACNGDSNPADQQPSCSGYAQVTLNNIVLPPTVPGVPVPPSSDLQTATTWPVTWLASSLGQTNTPPPISYNLQYSADNGATYQTINNVFVTAAGSAVSASFPGLDGTYSFRVQACAGTPQVCSPYSAASSPQKIVIQPSQSAFVQVPDVNTPRTSPGNVTINWDASAVSGGPVLYQVYVGPSTPNGAGPYSYSGSVTSSAAAYSTVTYDDPESKDGYYAYYVVACDAGTPSVCSAPAYNSGAGALVLPPTPVSAASIAVPSTDIHVSGWQVSWPASSPTGGPASNVTVVYYVQEFLNGVSQQTKYTTTNSYLFDSHTQNGSYTYEVMAAATDSTVDNGSDMAKTYWSNPSQAFNVVIAPPAPTTVVKPADSNLDGSFTVTWTEAAGGIAVTGYDVTLGDKSCDSEPNQGIVCTISWYDGGCHSSTTSCTFPAGHVAGPYYVEVAACYTAVCGPSTQGTGPVNIVEAAPPTLSGSGFSAAGTTTLSWTSVTGVTHYALYAAYQSVSTGTWGAFNNIANPVGTNRAVSLTSAQSAGHYYVEACDAVSCTAASNVAWLVRQAPGAPTLSGPSSSTSAGSVSISWNAPSGVANYQLYRSVEKSSSWAAYTETTTSSPNFSETLGTLVQAVRYHVEACNPIGCSDNSNTLTVSNANYDSGGGGGGGCPPPPFQCQLVMPDDTDGSARMQDGMVGAAAPSTAKSPADTERRDSLAPADAAELLAKASSTGEKDAADTPKTAASESWSYATLAGVWAAQNKPVALAQAMPALLAPITEPLVEIQAPPSAPVQQAMPSELLASADYPNPPVVTGHLSARQEFMLVYSTRSSVPRLLAGKPRRHGNAQPSRLATAARLPVQAIDPRLSMYPPLRKDPRVLAHFEAEGGQLPGELRQVDCGSTDADSDCSEPVGNALMVGFIYNSAGHLAEVDKLATDASQNVVQAKAIWQGLDATAAGQIDLEAFDNTPTPAGNAMPTSTAGAAFNISSTFDPASGLMTATTGSAVNAGQTVNAAYTWDGYNNLFTRTMAETIASSQTQASGLSESFTYDPLNRLTSTTTNFAPSESYNYQSDDGELISKGGFTNYQYDQAGICNGATTPGHLHALASVNTPSGGTRTFGYDANGNLLCESGDVNRAVTWSSYNKPLHIQGDSASEDFTYGPDRERLVTTVNKQVSGGADQVTTVYIDGLFESTYDGASGGYTYKHYIVIGGERVAVETITANSSSQQTGDTLGFFVHDQVGSVIAEVTENEDSTNQQMALMSYDAWGKARPTGGGTAWQPLTAGTFMNPTLAGQHEGFGGHENLDDVGLVDMEGRVYDPEIGAFLSPDPNVQFPASSQGYDRYVYVNDNPLSLSDPSGYFADSVNQDLGIVAAIVVDYLCYGTCSAVTAGFLAGAADGFVASGGNWKATEMSAAEGAAFAYVGDDVGWSDDASGLIGRTVAEGLMGGAFSEAGGGSFGDGFTGAASGVLASTAVNGIDPGEHTPIAIAARAVATAMIGGTVSSLTGGNFGDAALMAAMQRLMNDENASKEDDSNQTDIGFSYGLQGGFGSVGFGKLVKLSLDVDLGTTTVWLLAGNETGSQGGGFEADLLGKAVIPLHWNRSYESLCSGCIAIDQSYGLVNRAIDIQQSLAGKHWVNAWGIQKGGVSIDNHFIVEFNPKLILGIDIRLDLTATYRYYRDLFRY